MCVCLNPASSRGKLIYSVSTPSYIMGKSPFEKLLPIASENWGSRENVGITDMSNRIQLSPIGSDNRMPGTQSKILTSSHFRFSAEIGLHDCKKIIY